MATQKRPFAELGFVAEVGGSYRADLNSHDGQKIRGPRRGNKLRALGDLDVIRAAAAESESGAQEPRPRARAGLRRGLTVPVLSSVRAQVAGGV